MRVLDRKGAKSTKISRSSGATDPSALSRRCVSEPPSTGSVCKCSGMSGCVKSKRLGLGASERAPPSAAFWLTEIEAMGWLLLPSASSLSSSLSLTLVLSSAGSSDFSLFRSAASSSADPFAGPSSLAALAATSDAAASDCSLDSAVVVEPCVLSASDAPFSAWAGSAEEEWDATTALVKWTYMTNYADSCAKNIKNGFTILCRNNEFQTGSYTGVTIHEEGG